MGGQSIFLGGTTGSIGPDDFDVFFLLVQSAGGCFMVNSINPALFDVGLPGLVLIPRTLSGIMERYSQKLYVDSRKLDGMQLTYDVMLRIVFCILHHLMSCSIN